MSKREKVIFRIGRFLLIFALGFWMCFILPFAAWYIKHIPDHTKNLPFSERLRTNQLQDKDGKYVFYGWLSGFIKSWWFWALVSLAGSGIILISLLFILSLFVPPLEVLIDSPIKTLAILYLLLVISFDWIGFSVAKASEWDSLIWQAEPTAKLLVGGEEKFSELAEEDQTKLIRHVAEANIGMNKGTWLVSEGKAKLVNPPADTFAKFGGPGTLVVQEGHAVILEQKGIVSGVKGIGVHFLKPFERVNLVVYLAMSGEHFDLVHVVTKDKVVIEKIEMYIYHKVDSGDKSKKNGMYPFDVRVIMEKIWTPKGSTSEGKSANLGGAVQSVANTAVRDVVAKYDLADVITATGEIRKQLKSEFCQAIERVTDFAMGIKIIVVDIGAITIPVDAQAKLLERWLMDWESEIDRIKARKDIAKAEVSYHSQIAKAEASKIAKMAEGEGDAYALRAREVAKAEGAAEKIRQVGAVKGYLDNESFLGLVKYVFGEDFYRTLSEFQSRQFRSQRQDSSETPEHPKAEDTAQPNSEPKQESNG